VSPRPATWPAVFLGYFNATRMKRLWFCEALRVTAKSSVFRWVKSKHDIQSIGLWAPKAP
jgi:hypothetical protein